MTPMSLSWSLSYGSNWSTKLPVKTPRACVSQRWNGLRKNLKHNVLNENLGVGITSDTLSSGEDSTLPPLVRALKALAEENDASFVFPGHNRGRAAPTSLTQLIGKLPFVHDLYVPERPVLLEAQEKAAELFGASETWFLVGGTTCGVHAAIMANCMPGDTLILPRNAHFSALSGMVLSGAVPKYIIPEYDPEWDVTGGITPSQVENAIKELEMENRKPAAVLVVSPSYHGICSDIGAITNLCHSRNIPIIVDEAHGAHFIFNHQLPRSALSQGADLVVQSTHKVLCSLTQSSMLHASGSLIDRNRVRSCLQILQSTSPSPLLLASLDAARAHLSDNRGTAFNEAIDLAFEAKSMINEIPGISVMDLTNFPMLPAIDPLRLTIGVWNLGISGSEANKILCRDFQLFPELFGTLSFTLVFNLGTTREHISRLVSGLRHLSAIFLHSNNNELRVATDVRILAPFDEFNMIFNPREAFFARKRKVRVEDSVGEICGEIICPYPPGFPVLIPGEEVTETALKYLLHVKRKGVTIHGAADGLLSSIVVCDT